MAHPAEKVEAAQTAKKTPQNTAAALETAAQHLDELARELKAASPARALQDRLTSAIGDVELTNLIDATPDEKVWTLRQTTAFLFVTCGVFWALAATVAFAIL